MTGYKCQYLDLEWQNVSNVEIGAEGKKALTMNSTLMCFCSEKTPPPKANPSNATKSSETKRSNKPKIIRPVTSGQEFTIASDVFIYPKFIKGDTHSYFDEQYWENTYSFVQTASSDVDMTVIKKLAIRSRMNKYEKLWIKYIGRYLIGCEDADMIRKILNIFYEIPEQGVIAIEKECKLSERFTDIFKEMKRCFDIIIQNYGNKKVLKKIGLWKVDIVAISGRNYMTLFRLSQEKVMTLRDGHLDTNPIEEAKYVFSKYGGISKFYDGGLMIRYGIVTLDSMNSKLVTQSIYSNGGYAYYPGSAIVPRSIYSSTLAEGNGKVIDDLWIYFGKRDDKSFFVTMLALNVGVTIAIAAIPFLPLVVGGTAITTFTGSVIIPTGASILWTITSSIIAENMSDEEKNKFEQYRYTQNRAALSSVFEELKLNIVYSSIDNDYTSFSYMIFPSGETENLISIFVKNISDIYVDYYDNGDKNKYKSILSILGIENISQGDIYYKISLLVQSLTIEYIQERNYYVNGEENAAAIDGVDFINKIGKLKVSTTGNRQKVIKCYKKYSENGYIEIENLKGFKEYFEFSEGGFDEK